MAAVPQYFAQNVLYPAGDGSAHNNDALLHLIIINNSHGRQISFCWCSCS